MINHDRLDLFSITREKEKMDAIVESKTNSTSNDLSSWLQDHQIKSDIIDILNTENIKDLEQLKSMNDDTLEKIISQLKAIPGKKFHHAVITLRAEIASKPIPALVSPSSVAPVLQPQTTSHIIEHKVSERKISPDPESIRKSDFKSSYPGRRTPSPPRRPFDFLSITALKDELKQEREKIDQLEKRKARHERNVKHILHVMAKKGIDPDRFEMPVYTTRPVIDPFTTPPPIPVNLAVPSKADPVGLSRLPMTIDDFKAFAEPPVRVRVQHQAPSADWTCSTCQRRNKSDMTKCPDCFTNRVNRFVPAAVRTSRFQVRRAPTPPSGRFFQISRIDANNKKDLDKDKIDDKNVSIDKV